MTDKIKDKIHCENCGNTHKEEVEECKECGSILLFSTSEAVEFFEFLSKTFEDWDKEFSDNGDDDGSIDIDIDIDEDVVSGLGGKGIYPDYEPSEAGDDNE